MLENIFETLALLSMAGIIAGLLLTGTTLR